MTCLRVYFDDPAIICSFGRSDLPDEIIAKHNGPAEVESIFDKLKHDYNDPDFVTAKCADDLLYGNWLVRKRLGVRFLLDWQNSKLPQGIKEVIRRYNVMYGLNLDSERRGNKKRKSSDKLESEHKIQKKAEVSENSPVTEAIEGDMNEPKETYSLSGFCKSKKNKSSGKKKVVQISSSCYIESTTTN